MLRDSLTGIGRLRCREHITECFKIMALVAVNKSIDHGIGEYIRKLFDLSRKNVYVGIDYSIPQRQRQLAVLEYLKSCAGNETYQALLEKYLFELMKILPKTASCKFGYYKYQLMLSEWMLEIPHDFSENWIMIPCPLGKQVILIASKGITSAYGRKGWVTDSFYSALPGGHSTNGREYTILNCIWIESLGTFYLLDVLVWDGQPVMHHDAKYRLLWLSDKISQLPQLKDKNIETNKYPIMMLPNVPCSANLTEALKDFNYLHPLDGILFYHQDGPYIFGYSPLVTWLKPFMLSEVLGVTIPTRDHVKPWNYINFKEYIYQRTRNPKEKESLEAVLHLP